MNNNIHVFDVCGTLFHSNTTSDFIKYYHKSKRAYLKFCFVFILSGIFGKCLNKFFGFDSRSLIIYSLKGEKHTYLQNSASDFYDIFLVNRINERAFALLNTVLQNKGNNVILISASIEPVIKVIASKLDVKYNSTSLNYNKNGDFLGTIKKDNKGIKHELISEEIIRLVVTDNLDDIKLCLLSKKSIIFTKKKNFLYWKNQLGKLDHEIFQY